MATTSAPLSSIRHVLAHVLPKYPQIRYVFKDFPFDRPASLGSLRRRSRSLRLHPKSCHRFGNSTTASTTPRTFFLPTTPSTNSWIWPRKPVPTPTAKNLTAPFPHRRFHPSRTNRRSIPSTSAALRQSSKRPPNRRPQPRTPRTIHPVRTSQKNPQPPRPRSHRNPPILVPHPVCTALHAAPPDVAQHPAQPLGKPLPSIGIHNIP